MRTNYQTLPQVARQIGVNYDRLRYACLIQVVKPRTIGKARLFTPEQVEQLRTHFAKMDGKPAEENAQ